MAASFIYIQLFITQHYTKRLYHKNKRLGMTIIYNIFERLGKAFESLRTILVPWNRAFLRCSRHLHASNFTKPRSCNHGTPRSILLPRKRPLRQLTGTIRETSLSPLTIPLTKMRQRVKKYILLCDFSQLSLFANWTNLLYLQCTPFGAC